MLPENRPKYYLVESTMLPEIFIKVTEAKRLLETGEAQTVAEAVAAMGISRSAYYKYKDSVSPFTDLSQGSIITIHMMLRDKAGVLSSVLAIFAGTGANILAINQSIPVNGAASVTISVRIENQSVDELIRLLENIDGVIRIEVVAG